ncbi:hypothetical protein BDN70DRAFT_884675 [Pholiota conissans]|uniref:Uncharacterized protein n=1 Tax=Pholiota conissans TaxID=109636 RepID=A0A9P5YT14_9AGAR|nr:hypothetical protein BDN70DRAFT_884675 [Pholiota conissans]
MQTRLYRPNGRFPTARLFARAFTQAPPARRFSIGRYLVIGAAAGTVGGGLIIGAGYAWYRYSGLHHLVERFRPAMALLNQTGSELGKEAPSHVLRHLRGGCKAYVAHLPGAGFLVDKAFDGIDDAVDAHVQEANTLIRDALVKISLIVVKNRNEPTASNAVEIMSIARQLAKDLRELGIKAGQPLTQNLDLENKSAQLKEATAAAYDVAKTKSAELTQTLADAAEKAKISVQNAEGPANAVEKAKSFIFRKSDK